jgi:hypothetical protein
VNAAAEWASLVMTAVLGTDRRPPPPSAAELAVWCTEADVAVNLLDRAAALVTAQRAGVLPLPPVVRLRSVSDDGRPPCPPGAARVLSRLLWRNEAELLAEWLTRLDEGGWRLPAEHAPALLARTQHDGALAQQARAAAGPLAAWLEEVLPPPARPARSLASTAAPAAAAEPIDIAADADPVEAIVDRFRAGQAGAQRQALRATILRFDPRRLADLADALDAVAGQPLTAALRHELADLARLRAAVVDAFREDGSPR